ncbi:hypothetical protein NON42_001165 [Campylobacter coli]|nr:hypothetical protein [Campylobacter coli]EIT8635662.1 hypothetical protein [Campylobacter coli]EJM4836581.1 hypothetical protein [Campylobacter coli]
MINKILEVKDDYKSPIVLNDNLVHNVSPNVIQVEKELANKYDSNTLHILYTKQPKMVTDTLPADQQIVDIPEALLECLLLGIASKVSNIGQLTNDPRTGTSYMPNVYIERYEKAIEKVIGEGFLYQLGLNKRDVHTKGFI